MVKHYLKRVASFGLALISTTILNETLKSLFWDKLRKTTNSTQMNVESTLYMMPTNMRGYIDKESARKFKYTVIL